MRLRDVNKLDTEEKLVFTDEGEVLLPLKRVGKSLYKSAEDNGIFTSLYLFYSGACVGVYYLDKHVATEISAVSALDSYEKYKQYVHKKYFLRKRMIPEYIINFCKQFDVADKDNPNHKFFNRIYNRNKTMLAEENLRKERAIVKAMADRKNWLCGYDCSEDVFDELNKEIIYNGETVSYRDMIVWSIQDGSIPQIVDDEYRLYITDDTFVDLSENQYMFAVFIFNKHQPRFWKI